MKKDATDNLSTTIYNLLMALKIPATYSYVNKTLKEHPDVPSLLSLAESLPNWGVKTEGVKGEVADLSDVDYPSIVHLSKSNMKQSYAVLENIEDGHASIIHSSEGRKSYTLDEFAEIWSGILLRVFPEKNADEPDYEAHQKSQRLVVFRKLLTKIGLPFLFLIAFGYGLAQAGFLDTLIPLGLAKVIGFILCSIMVAASLGSADMLRSLCPMGKVVNCARVMRSPAGRIFGISMAEWGLLYFGGGLLTLLASFFFGQLANDLLFLGLIGLLTLPYTLFSIVYQAFFVRSWCWMCLVIMGIFWFEFYLLYDRTIPFLTSGALEVSFPLSILLGFGITALTWISLRSVLNEAETAKKSEHKITQMRREPEYIKFKLDKADPTNMGNLPYEVEIGPSDAKITITAVVNPLCGHCWKAFNQLDQMISIAKGNLKGAVRFLVTPDKEEETPTEIEEFLDREVSLLALMMAQDGKRELVHQALADWFVPGDSFSKAKYNRWQQKYTLGDEKMKQKAKNVLNMHRSWAMNSNIAGTPALFFNNRRLPVGFQLDDLKIFLMRQFQD
jgi:uncharacterized membrane protein/protein-disulfide isomerase